MNPVILDVDTGIDDAIAIILAIASKNIELIGITTVAGNVNVDKSTRNTLRVLKFLSREDIEVHRGSNKPLKRSLVDASQIHGRTGLANQLEDIEVEEIKEETAFEFLRDNINKYSDEITIITTGPQTNIANLLIKEPELGKKIKRLIMMGGVVKGRGNHTPVSEFNILTDPESAKIVFDSGIKNKTLISLDVTRKALLYEKDLALIKNKKIKNFLEKLTFNYMKRYFDNYGEYACPMHDPLTVLYYINSNIIEIQKEYVTVETNSTFCDGMTICDFDRHWDKTPNINISVNIDESLFKKEFFNLINSFESRKINEE